MTMRFLIPALLLGLTATPLLPAAPAADDSLMLGVVDHPVKPAAPPALDPLKLDPDHKDRSGNPLPPGAVARFYIQTERRWGNGSWVQFFPDGKRLATNLGRGRDDGIQVWDVATGKDTALAKLTIIR